MVVIFSDDSEASEEFEEGKEWRRRRREQLEEKEEEREEEWLAGWLPVWWASSLSLPPLNSSLRPFLREKLPPSLSASQGIMKGRNTRTS